MQRGTREGFLVESTCGFCGLGAYLSLVFLGRPWPTTESGTRVRENDEPHFHWGICLDGYELVATTSIWVRCWCF